MPKKLSRLILVMLMVSLFAWSPWLSRGSAEDRAVDSFVRAWESVADGCGINCKGCGAVTSQRVPFGVRVTIEYACGLISEDSPEYHQRATAFISPFSTVHGLPTP